MLRNPASGQNEQPDLFGAPPAQSYLPSIDKVRADLLHVLQEATSATTMPWPARKAAYWKTVFPQMSKWLPSDEAESLRAAFAEEIKRLEAAS